MMDDNQQRAVLKLKEMGVASPTQTDVDEYLAEAEKKLTPEPQDEPGKPNDDEPIDIFSSVNKPDLTGDEDE